MMEEEIMQATNAMLDEEILKRDEYGPGFAFETASEIVKRTNGIEKRWLIKGVLAEGETSAWIAPPGGMKSALMMQAAICVADFQEWNGKKHACHSAVAYFALERADLVRRRLRAHIARMDKTDPTFEIPEVTIVPGMVDLMDPASVKKVIITIKNIESFSGSCVNFIIFDTFAKLIAAGGGDEQQAKDQGKVFANIQRIKDGLSSKLRDGARTPGPHVALVGHTGKDEARGPRGSNAILGDADLVVQISGDKIKTASVTKANDLPEGPLFSFQSETHEFGVDEDGDPMTVNIAVPANADDAAPADRGPRLSPDQQTMLDILLSAGQRGLSTEEWNERAKEAGLGLRRAAKLYDLKSSLLKKGMVRQFGEAWTVAH